MIYLIALLHAVPVFVIGLASGSRSLSINTAIFMACLGVLTGDPAYMVVDLIAVGLALWICLASISERPNQRADNQHSPTWVSLGGSNQTIVKPQESQACSAYNTSSSKTAGGDETRPSRTTSGEQQMGLLSAMRLSSLYDKRIKAYGLEPRELPPELHSIICSSFERRAERFANMSQLFGGERRDFIEASIEDAADLTVLCGIGPNPYDDMHIGGRASEIIEELARTWIADGPEGSIELQLMQAVNQSGHLNLDFANAFKSERARQNREILASTQAEERMKNGVAAVSGGYVEHSARLAALRAQVTAARPASIAVVLEPRRTRDRLNDNSKD